MGGNRGRRAAALVLGLGMLLAASMPVSAHEVVSYRDSFVAGYAEWGAFDWDRMVGKDTFVVMEEAGEGEVYLAYQVLRLTEVTCTNGTARTGDDYPGSQGTMVMGDGMARTASLDAKQLRWARAAGKLEVYKYSVSTCDDEWDLLSVRRVSVTLDLTAAGKARRSHEPLHFVEPGSFMEKDMLQDVIRPAAGSVTVGDTTRTIGPDIGVIGRMRTRVHYVIH